MKVLIGVATYDDKLDIHTVESLLGMKKPCDCDIAIISRMRVDRARNLIAKDAIDKGLDAVLFIDTAETEKDKEMTHWFQAKGSVQFRAAPTPFLGVETTMFLLRWRVMPWNCW